MTVSEICEHFASKNVAGGVCFHLTKKYVLHQLGRLLSQTLADKQTCQPTWVMLYIVTAGLCYGFG